MAQKIGQIAYTLARQLLVKDKGGIASLPSPKEILTKVQDMFDMLKAGGYNPVSAGKAINSTDDLKKVLTDVEMKLTIDKNLRSSQSEGIEEVMKKMDRGIPLNPSDQAKMEGIETVADDKVLDAFKGFKPRVIQGGKGAETEAEMIARMNKQNKDSVARLKEKKEKDLGSKLEDYDGDPDAMAIGGRAGFGKGDIVTKGLPFIMKEINKRFGKKAITTADKIDRPESALNREMFGAFNERVNRKTLDVPSMPSGFQLSREKLLKNFPELDESYADEIMAMDKELQGRVLTMLKDRRKNPEAYDKLLMEKGETLDFQGEFDRSVRRSKNAKGGRIGFSGGGAGFAGNQMEGKIYTRSEMENDTYVKNDMPEYVMSDTPGSPQVSMGEFGPVNVGIFGGGGYSKNEIVPGVNQATTNQNYGIAGQIPIGDTGFTIGGDYMKSRTNDRFTGDAIPGQTFKSVPTDSDRFNVGINFRKPLSGGMFGLSKKDGGRIGFDEGGPSNKGRRSFLKLMAGLASLPVVGKFLKPAAKVVDTAGPAIAEGVKLGFDKFVMLVNKIKSMGKKTDKVTQTEREVGYTYKGKDGSEYELVEDLSTGSVRVTKDKPGGMTIGDESFDTIEDRSTFVLRRNRADETTKGRKPPDEYDEVKEVPSRDGTFDDIDEVDNNTVREILEELGETKIKKAGGGLAYMLGE